MRQSQLFTKTRKEVPKDEESKNAQLLIQAGFIHKEMAGVYTYLPLGLRVLKKIEQIIREEMNALGAQEMLLTTLQDPALWEKSSRWSDTVVDIWFKSKLANGSDIGIANTHEEPLTALLTHYISSYKDLPVYAYQFQNKFRNELRAKSGIMRTREFLMKDMYSFSRSEQEFQEFYELCASAYMRIFDRLGIGEKTYRTTAAGGSFTTGYTDEFQTVCLAGEDTIYIDTEKKRAVNKEVYNDTTLQAIGLQKENLVQEKAVEVGNIFPLGTKYAEALGLRYQDEQGKEHPVFMGSYGIGLGRIMGTIVEIMHDARGIVWPQSIAPFLVHIVELAGGKDMAEKAYKELQNQGIEVLYDDRDMSAGEKLKDADLLGIPVRVIASEKTQDMLELKKRTQEKAEMVALQDIVQKL